VAVSASLVDPYIAILRDDASLLLLQADASGDLDEVSLPDDIANVKCRSICLYHDKSRTFTAASRGDAGDAGDMLLFLLTSDHKISVSISYKTDDEPDDC